MGNINYHQLYYALVFLVFQYFYALFFLYLNSYTVFWNKPVNIMLSFVMKNIYFATL